MDLKDHLFVLRIPKESLRRGGNQQVEDSFTYSLPSSVPPITEQKQRAVCPEIGALKNEYEGG